MNLSDKVVAVTGAGGGIGRALVQELVRRGATAAAIDINEAALRETAAGVPSGTESAGRQVGDAVSIHCLDITDRGRVNACADEIRDLHGRIDGVINCAGIIQPFVPFTELGIDGIERIMNVNFYGTVNVLRSFLPHLVERPEAHIANVSSMGGFFPFPGQAVYGASKAAVKLLSEGLYAELRRTRVRVTVVIPGGIATNIMANSGLRMNERTRALQNTIKLPTPEFAAARIIRGIERNRFRVFIGIDAKALNVLYKFFPRLAIAVVSKAMAGTVLEKP